MRGVLGVIRGCLRIRRGGHSLVASSTAIFLGALRSILAVVS